jgi:hypothetical protein
MGGFASHLEMPCGMMVAKVLEEAKGRSDGPPADDFCAVALRVKHPGENTSGPFPVNAPVAKPLTDSLRRR